MMHVSIHWTYLQLNNIINNIHRILNCFNQLITMMMIKFYLSWINYYRDGYQDFSCVCKTFYKQDTGSFVSLNVAVHVSVDDSDSWISSHIYYIPIDWMIVNGTLFHVYYIQLKMQTFYCKSYRRTYGSYSYVVPIVCFHGNGSYNNDTL